jgi:hypothetical protein
LKKPSLFWTDFFTRLGPQTRLPPVPNFGVNSYDGASNTRGELNGLRALIMRENSSAYYIHFFAHHLQPVIIVVAKKNDDASDFFDMVSLLLNVAGASCKRKDMIRESQQERVKKL